MGLACGHISGPLNRSLVAAGTPWAYLLGMRRAEPSAGAPGAPGVMHGPA